MIEVIVSTILAVVGGGLLFSRLIVDPYLEYRTILKEISYTLIFHAGLICSAPFPQRDDETWSREDYEKARDEHIVVSKKVRDLSARLRASATPLLRRLRLSPPPRILKDAAGRLIRISNCMLEHDKKYDLIYEDMKAIEQLLKIDVASG